jgi:hypothetical protein
MTKEEILRNFNKSTQINREQAEFLYDNIIDIPGEGRIIDVGTGRGHATLLFALTKPDWTIYTIDGYGLYGSIQNVWNAENENSFKANGVVDVLNYWKEFNVDNIIQIVGNTWDIHWELPADFIFIDADHSYDGVRKDVEKFFPFLKDGSKVGFHDYNNVFGVKEYIDGNLLDKWNIEIKEWTCILTKK